MTTPLLSAEGVTVRFGGKPALEDVSITLRRGTTLGLVGESGSGKSTLLRVLLKLQPVSAGRVRLDGADISEAREVDLRPLRQAVQVVFQNPHSALDPRSTVHDSVAEPLRILGGRNRLRLRDHVLGLLFDVGLGPEFLWRYPHELSGGQKQRVCIARALAPEPRALLLDEPTSALDVSVQAQIIDLLRTLQARHRLTYLFVSHNLAVVRLLCSEVVVLRQGRLVEQGPVEQVLGQPREAYTRALLEAVLPPAVTSLA